MNSDIPNEQLPDPKPIPASLLSRQENKSTHLVNNADAEFSVEGKRRWYNFEFESAIYVREIHVVTEGYDSWDELEFQLYGIDSNNTIQKIRGEGGSFRVVLNQMLTGFSFRPEAKFSMFKRQSINKIEVIGYTADELSILENALSSVKQEKQENEEEKQRLIQEEAEVSERVSALKKEIETVTKNKNELATQVGQATGQLETLQGEVSSVKTQAQKLSDDEKDTLARLEDRKKEQRQIQSDINDLKSEYEQFTRKIRLLPSELAGYVEEGTRSIKMYAGMALPFVIIVVCITWALFNSSVDLSHLWKREEGIDIWVIFLTRIPFVLIVITLLEVCGYVIGRFIYEVIRIHRQRMNLQKISIIAKDVSVASANNSDMTNDEIFEAEVKLKMELLRAHMKEDVGEDFKYGGTFLQAAVKAALPRSKKASSSDE